MVGEDEYFSGKYLQDILLSGLLELGGPELLAAAHDEAARHVEEHHRWDGRGDEPAERVSAYNDPGEAGDGSVSRVPMRSVAGSVQ